MTDCIHSSLNNLFVAIRHVGIAICTTSGTQQHIGIVHKNLDTNDVQLLHLAWHHDLRNQSPNEFQSNKYIWVDPAISPYRLRQVAAACRRVWKANQDGVPYAFSSPENSIDQQTGEFLIGPSKLGLTCASFVLAVFHSAGLPLVKYDTWSTHRGNDDEWQRFIVQQLKGSNPPASAEHISAITNKESSVRYRPEEVAGAAIVESIPASFNDAAEQAVQIMDILKAK